MSGPELYIGKEPVIGEDIMFLVPQSLTALKYIQRNTFDFATIKDCKVHELTSAVLTSLCSCMKPGGRVEIIISHPISAMQSFDSKQIEAHAELSGFEKISIKKSVFSEDKTGVSFPTESVFFYKPLKEKEIVQEYKKETKREIYEQKVIKPKNEESVESSETKKPSYRKRGKYK